MWDSEERDGLNVYTYTRGKYRAVITYHTRFVPLAWVEEVSPSGGPKVVSGVFDVRRWGLEALSRALVAEVEQLESEASGDVES